MPPALGLAAPNAITVETQKGRTIDLSCRACSMPAPTRATPSSSVIGSPAWCCRLRLCPASRGTEEPPGEGPAGNRGQRRLSGALGWPAPMLASGDGLEEGRKAERAHSDVRTASAVPRAGRVPCGASLRRVPRQPRSLAGAGRTFPRSVRDCLRARERSRAAGSRRPGSRQKSFRANARGRLRVVEKDGGRG